MNEILQANIFFIIASIATVVFCILLTFVLYQVFKIVRSIRSIVERIEEGSEIMSEDMTYMRNFVAGGGIFSQLFQFIMGKARRRVDEQEED